MKIPCSIAIYQNMNARDWNEAWMIGTDPARHLITIKSNVSRHSLLRSERA